MLRVLTAGLLLLVGLLKLMAAVALIGHSLSASDDGQMAMLGVQLVDKAPLLFYLQSRYSLVLDSGLLSMGVAMLWAALAPLLLAAGFSAMRGKRRGLLLVSALLVLLVEGVAWGVGIFGLLGAASVATALLAMNLASHVGFDVGREVGGDRHVPEGAVAGEKGVDVGWVEVVESEQMALRRDWLDRVLVVVSVLGFLSFAGLLLRYWW